MNNYWAVLNKYAVFGGRATRKEFWNFVFTTGLIVIATAIFGSIISEEALELLEALFGLYALAIAIPMLAVTVRRMHDVGKSGWYIFAPVYSWILLCTDGDKGTNQYGPAPKT